jgi:hypothetical protein
MSRILGSSRKKLGLGVAAACTVSLTDSLLFPATSPAETAASPIVAMRAHQTVPPPGPARFD